MIHENDKGILVVSFGTLHRDTCDKTIGAIEEDLARAFPKRKLYRAWTSSFIIKRLEEKEGLHLDTVEEALMRMKDEGITDLLVQPTHLLEGSEYKKLSGILQEHAHEFETIKLGRPVLDSQEDIRQLTEVIASEIYPESVSDSHTALLFMGHGSANEPDANAVYSELQKQLNDLGLDEVLIATLEGRPSLEDAISRIAGDRSKISKVVITPLMIVAGNHAIKDMDGDQEGSWKNLLLRRGFDVTTVIKGLGEYPGLRNMLIVHAVGAPAFK